MNHIVVRNEFIDANAVNPESDMKSAADNVGDLTYRAALLIGNFRFREQSAFLHIMMSDKVAQFFLRSLLVLAIAVFLSANARPPQFGENSQVRNPFQTHIKRQALKDSPQIFVCSKLQILRK